MCSKKIEKRQRVDSDEIVETGEQKIVEMLEVKGKYCPIQVIDDECMSAVSSEFARPNEEMSRAIAALEDIEDYEQVLSLVEAVNDDTVEEIQKAKRFDKSIADGCVLQTPTIVESPPIGLTESPLEDVGSGLFPQLQESGESFYEIADEAEQINDELDSELAALLAELENIF